MIHFVARRFPLLTAGSLVRVQQPEPTPPPSTRTEAAIEALRWRQLELGYGFALGNVAIEPFADSVPPLTVVAPV